MREVKRFAVSVQIRNSKKSKTGRFKLIKDGNNFKTIKYDEDGEDILQTVFKDGELLIDDNFAQIQKRAQNYSNYPVNR